jgi:phosphoglycolate phosphatase
VYQAYLFDLDGTLVDTAPDLNTALNYALQTTGHPGVDEAETRQWVGHGAMVMIEQALKHVRRSNTKDEPLACIHQLFLDHYATHIADKSLPYPNAVKTLKTLRARGSKLGVVTNKAIHLTRILLDHMDLEQYFDVVVGGDSLQVRKPGAEPALYACNELDAVPSETLFVGDSSTDIGCARAAGCDVVCVTDGYNHGANLEDLGADSIIDSLMDLLREERFS